MRPFSLFHEFKKIEGFSAPLPNLDSAPMTDESGGLPEDISSAHSAALLYAIDLYSLVLLVAL